MSAQQLLPVESPAAMVRVFAAFLALPYKLDVETMLRLAARKATPPSDVEGFPDWRADLIATLRAVADKFETDPSFFDRKR